MNGHAPRMLAGLAARGASAAARPLGALGLIDPVCPWRRTTQIGLTTEGSRFGLTAFGLDLWSDARPPRGAMPTAAEAERHVFHRFATFLEGEPSTHTRIMPSRGCHAGRPVRVPTVRRGDVDPSIATSTCAFWFEPMGPAGDPISRFRPPAPRPPTAAGRPELLNVVCRVSPDRRCVDLWVHVHHAGADGVPMQEMLSRLERAWGVREHPAFPTPLQWSNETAPKPCSLPGDRPTELVLDFVDFRPLLALRRALNDRHAAAIGNPLPAAAVLVWRLARQPGFAGKKFASTVDVPSSAAEPRCVDMVVIRPADFGDDVIAYGREFNRQVEACRTRQSVTHGIMQAIAMLPPRLALAALRASPALVNATFGSVGLSIIRDAKVFLAPMPDPGFADGFAAIGGMSLPAADGTPVGALSVKGDPGKPALLAAAIRSAVQSCSAGLAAPGLTPPAGRAATPMTVSATNASGK